MKLLWVVHIVEVCRNLVSKAVATSKGLFFAILIVWVYSLSIVFVMKWRVFNEFFLS